MNSMKAETTPAVERRGTRNGRKVWVAGNVLDYSPVRGYLPVRHLSITPVTAGILPLRLGVASLGELSVMRLQVRTDATGLTVLKPDYLAFWLCSPETSGVRVNGVQASADRMFLPDSGCFHIQGGEREVFAGAFRIEPLRRTIAALRGVGPEDVDLSLPFLTLPGELAERLRRLVATIIPQAASTAPADGRQILETLAEAFLMGKPGPAGRARSQSTIVRRAEECFAEADGERVSLADLCAAAGVGKTSLYNAFRVIYGQTPLRYFQLRRLAKAREILLQASPERGEVKRAALGVGLTELGRFSVEYRTLFGESPSVTLRRRRK